MQNERATAPVRPSVRPSGYVRLADSRTLRSPVRSLLSVRLDRARHECSKRRTDIALNPIYGAAYKRPTVRDTGKRTDLLLRQERALYHL